MDGMEISQFTYFQQMGGRDLSPITVELTYGIERICMFINDIKSIFDIPWNAEVRYGEVRHYEEVEHSEYAFNQADVPFFREQFDRWEAEASRLLDLTKVSEDGPEPAPLVLPAYEATLKCSHLFNTLDARGALSVTERAANIQRIRKLACRGADAWLVAREEVGFPLSGRDR
jgi:glycyl-tRNA synthetase alpha chain